MEKNSLTKYQHLLLIAIACCLSVSIMAKSNVHVEKPGSLGSLLPSSDSSLKITGSINGSDIKHLRQLIEQGVNDIDISEVNIVAGGEAYHENNKTENDIIGPYMFSNCINLENITLPKTVFEIQSNAFSKSGLKKIDIPNSVSKLGRDAFAYCKSLSNVIIGSRVSILEQGVFYSSEVKTVYSKPQTPPAPPAYLFSTNPKIVVYTSVLEDYKQSEWTKYGSLFGGLEEIYPEEQDTSTEVNKLLPTYFEDAACTALKAEYKNMSDEAMTSAMNKGGLPQYIIDIALKLKNDKWNKYEKDFRIHSYNAYSDANYWNEIMKSTGGSFMGNPTGIYTKGLESLYVFVDSDIPEDATLYIAGCVGDDLISNAKSGKRLNKGLNIVDGSKDALYYIIYTADTRSKTKKLSEWPEIKIHIQGGTVNGYYDVTRHSENDYVPLLNAATHNIFTVKGKRSLFNFKRSSYKEIWPSNIQRSIEWFDDMTLWQKELMGYSETVASGLRAKAPHYLTGGEAIYPIYYNNPNFAIQGNSSSAGWANSSNYRTCYNSVDCIRASFDVSLENHDDWCVGHECGHNNQQTINLEGGTEVSNNLFSNYCRYLTGNVTSAGESITSTMNEFVQHIPYSKRSGLMRMYYQLYLYYHLAQHNTSFYPELFKKLREDPIERWKNTNNSSLKFVRKVCEVAQEDLTDFFYAWGFFEPCTNLKVDDYGEYTMSVTKSDIIRTLTEISKYPRKNREIIFIEDRVDYLLTNGYLGEAGKKRRDSHQVGQCGDLGQFTDYLPGACKPSKYTYLQADSFYVMQGEGGVGFIILDDKEKIEYASNSRKFFIPSNIKAGFTIYSVDADGTLNNVTKSGEGTQIAHLNTAGILSENITEQAIKTIISGDMNGTDFAYLRKIINEGNTQSIDIAETNIVSGGNPYYENYKTATNVIGSHMFYMCNNLISAILPLNATRIGNNAFAKSGIQEIVIPDAINTIEMDAFAYCPNLKRVVIGSNVKRLAQGVFYSSPVKEAFVKATTPPAIATYLFSSKPIIHVYASSLEAYKASAWAQFGTIVGDLDEYGSSTSIELPDNESKENIEKSPVYDLQGRVVKKLLPSTIYIRNGKKFMTKP